MCSFTERLFGIFHDSQEGDRSSAGQHGSSATNNQSPHARPRQTRRRTLFLVVHPFLIAIAPVLHLYARNMNEADVKTALIFAGAALAATTLMFALAWLCLRNSVKAAVLVSVFNLLFYAYGWVFDFLIQHEPFRWSYTAWHRVLLVLSYTIVITVGVLLHYSRRHFRTLSRFLSTMMVILLAMFTVKIAHHHVRIALIGRSFQLPRDVAATIDQRERPAPLDSQSKSTPDVYYIILDGYARADTLMRECQFDNREFLAQLRDRGFYVADQSCSNYPMTFMSLASSLNMCYLNEAMTTASGFGAVWPFWDRGAVAHLFQSKGYRFIYFATNFKKEFTGADIVLQPKPGWLLSQFAQVLLRTTALRLFEPQMADQHLFEFAKLEQIPRIAGPKFTFCHIIAPHPPYVFDGAGHICCDVPQSMFFRDGAQQHQNPGSAAVRSAYIEQLKYVNRRIIEVVDSIVAQSVVPPVIMIQGDHGTFFTVPAETTDESFDRFALERMPILNAYLVPEPMRRKLRPDISPVNSFRLLFNECFGEHFEILPERHYVGWYYSHRLKEVTQLVHPEAVRLGIAQRATSSEGNAR